MSYDNLSSVSQNVLKFYQQLKSNNSGTAKVKIVKNERDPPLFTGKLLIKFQNILRNTTQVIVRHRICLQTDGRVDYCIRVFIVYNNFFIPPATKLLGGIMVSPCPSIRL
jgi:hypothetical protein